MSLPIDRILTKTKNDAEGLMNKIQSLIAAINMTDIKFEERSIFSNDLSQLADDVTKLNETILNSAANDEVDLGAYVVAPSRLARIDTLNLLIVDKNILKLAMKEDDVQVQNESAFDVFNEGDEINEKVKAINETVGNSMAILRQNLR